MPRSCSVCAHGSTADVTKALANGDSIRSVARRFDLTPAAVGRHLRSCLRTARRKESTGDSREGGAADSLSRFDTLAAGRCPTCGLCADDEEPKALIRRAERALSYGESIVMRAVEEKDDRLALQGLDRVRSSLEQLLKVHGLLVPDGASTFVDARRQQIQVLGQLSVEELRAIAAGRPISDFEDASQPPAIEGVAVLKTATANRG